MILGILEAPEIVSCAGNLQKFRRNIQCIDSDVKIVIYLVTALIPDICPGSRML